jgi:hypothetical protein
VCVYPHMETSSGYIQGAFREHSGNIQGTFREHSGNVQGTFREYSGNVGQDVVLKQGMAEHSTLLCVIYYRLAYRVCFLFQAC